MSAQLSKTPFPLRCEIFHVDGALFDKTGMLAEFPQLCNFERFVV
jgi:hypothetical protein